MRICRFADEDLQMKKCARKKRHRITQQCCCCTIYISALQCVKSAPHSIFSSGVSSLFPRSFCPLSDFEVVNKVNGSPRRDIQCVD